MVSFNKVFLSNYNLKKHIGKFNFTSIINNVGLYVTSNKSTQINLMKKYFYSLSLLNFTGSVIFIKFIYGEFNYDNVYWIDNKYDLIKGEDENNYYYKYLNHIVKIDKSEHMVEVYGIDENELFEFFPYLIKIIEGLIIEQHIKLGYFPMHGGMMTKEEKSYLILGNSQSGKTTLMNYLDGKDYTYLSDDIIFFDINGNAYPFGHYKKVICEEKIFNDNFVEKISGIKREVVKLEKVFTKHFTVNEILILKIVKQENHSLDEIEDSRNSIFSLVSEYPNEYFIKSEYEYCRALQVINHLIKAKVKFVSLAWNRDFEGVEGLWEMKNHET